MGSTLIKSWVQSNSKIKMYIKYFSFMSIAKSARWKDFPFPYFFILYFISYCKKKLRLYIENLKFVIPTTL